MQLAGDSVVRFASSMYLPKATSAVPPPDAGASLMWADSESVGSLMALSASCRATEPRR